MTPVKAGVNSHLRHRSHERVRGEGGPHQAVPAGKPQPLIVELEITP